MQNINSLTREILDVIPFIVTLPAAGRDDHLHLWELPMLAVREADARGSRRSRQNSQRMDVYCDLAPEPMRPDSGASVWNL